MNSNRIKELVKDKTATFSFYRDRQLWYVTDDGFEFPVPIEDIGGATFLSEHKAITLMRYIRKHLDTIEEGES